ncbi:MAG: hypothetical protein TRG1_1222 [Flavobacteriaceae bacterium FS1-H7996/R]|nr:MAG: hypothetical protein TRG1_1222 [Flavobacteriaceae bacterium FS1-H7996/R]
MRLDKIVRFASNKNNAIAITNPTTLINIKKLLKLWKLLLFLKFPIVHLPRIMKSPYYQQQKN